MVTAAAVADTSEPAMESCWGIPTDRLMNVVVTETNGNCLLDSLCIPNVTLAPGETTIPVRHSSIGRTTRYIRRSKLRILPYTPYIQLHKNGQGTRQCSMHYIRYDVLYDYVLKPLQIKDFPNGRERKRRFFLDLFSANAMLEAVLQGASEKRSDGSWKTRNPLAHTSASGEKNWA